MTQTLRNGSVRLEDVPPPALRPGGVLVRTSYSLISAGTERAKVALAQKSLLGKARSRPEQARQALESLRSDGLLATYRKIANRLDALQPLGYSCSGQVVAVGAGVGAPCVGDRIACAGTEHANHAEVNFVPRNLCVKVPDGVGMEEAAFATVGAIALQGARQSEARLGEVVVVIGLGLVGQITVQLLAAAGCTVIGLDPVAGRCALAGRLGAVKVATSSSECSALCATASTGHGADAVIIAAATTSTEPVAVAGRLCREKGRVVVVGDVPMDLPRAQYYAKELELRLSRSYGPGRYDPSYEENGHDYPYGYVRWTEGRNMESFLGLVSRKLVEVGPLITHRFSIDEAVQAYRLIEGRTAEPYLGVLLEFPAPAEVTASASNLLLIYPGTEPASKEHADESRPEALTVGLIGAGNFAQDTLIPALKSRKEVRLRAVATASGLSARSVADRFGFERCASAAKEILEDPGVAVVLVATRHDSHAELVVQGLRAGKSVFVEKPLALNEEQLQEVIDAFSAASGRKCDTVLMVGFNRRFASFSQEIKEFVSGRGEPLVLHYRVNAGFVPGDHWTQDPRQGGGRILGEVCHFVDWMQFLIGTPPVQVVARSLPNGGVYRDDNAVIVISYADGSLGNIVYCANGDKRMGKERVEVLGGGRMAVLEDFRQLTLSGGGSRRVQRHWFGPEKGHRAEVEAFLRAVRNGGPMPIPLVELVSTTRVTFAISESLSRGAPVGIPLGENASSDAG